VEEGQEEDIEGKALPSFCVLSLSGGKIPKG
jgi:hypothetical protein